MPIECRSFHDREEVRACRDLVRDTWITVADLIDAHHRPQEKVRGVSSNYAPYKGFRGSADVTLSLWSKAARLLGCLPSELWSMARSGGYRRTESVVDVPNLEMIGRCNYSVMRRRMQLLGVKHKVSPNIRQCPKMHTIIRLSRKYYDGDVCMLLRELEGAMNDHANGIDVIALTAQKPIKKNRVKREDKRGSLLISRKLIDEMQRRIGRGVRPFVEEAIREKLATLKSERASVADEAARRVSRLLNSLDE